MVSYDITADRSRRKIQKMMEGIGERVQYSVFECKITEGQLRGLKERLLKLIDKDTDSIRFYSLCSHCEGVVEILGNGTVREDEDFFIV